MALLVAVVCYCIFTLIYAKNVLILLGDDVGFESGIYGNKICKTPNIDQLATRSLVFDNGFTSVSSCSPSRSALLTGLPHHQNGMYGLENGYHHFQSFSSVKSLPNIVSHHKIYTGIIGKKHVAPEAVYQFDYSKTEMDGYSVNQVGRNITLMKILVSEFLSQAGDKDFLLYVAFHDAHRCGHTQPELGVFCEKFGDPSIPGMGVIPDWKPLNYDPKSVLVPKFVPDTPASRADIAAQYKTMSRFDQGVGLVMSELKSFGRLDDTLVILSSDNGIPFPNGRTNLYDSGAKEPFMISHPMERSMWGKRTNQLVSLLDVVPTVLNWFSVPFPSYSIFHGRKKVQLTGKSLMPLLNFNTAHLSNKSDAVFTSQSLHEITMYYPMRSIRTLQYKLIQNLFFKMPFPIDQDFYLSPTFQDMLNRTRSGAKLNWFKSLEMYYNRAPYELYDITKDDLETNNLFEDEAYREILSDLQIRLKSWQNVTSDPWICAPGGVLEDSGTYKLHPRCMSLLNGY